MLNITLTMERKPMADKSVIIIGAGVAGLTAGCYAQMNDYITEIFEMGLKPGGLCTAWERKGYTIDGCLHWLVGSSPNSDYYRLWQEVGVLQGKQVINHEQFYRVESTNGKVLTLYTDIDRLEQHLKEIAPEDSAFIKELTNSIRHFTKINFPIGKAPELYMHMRPVGVSEGEKLLPNA
jgi:phytoene dehydrogenase-like protein